MPRCRPVLCVIIAWGAALLWSSSARTEDAAALREHHAWARFPAGAWKRVCRSYETLDEQGCVTSTSTTETTTTLVKVDDQGYTLRIDVVVEIAGKRFTAAPQFTSQGFHDETSGQTVEVKKLGDSATTIDGAKIPVELQQILSTGPEVRQVSQVQYASDVYPFVLRRETTTADSTGKEPVSSAVADVIALDMPHKVLAEIRPVSLLRITHTQPKGLTIRLEMHCADVPGGVVGHTSKELNSQGQVIARSTLELIDFSADGEQPYSRPRFFQRFRRHSR